MKKLTNNYAEHVPPQITRFSMLDPGQHDRGTFYSCKDCGVALFRSRQPAGLTLQCSKCAFDITKTIDIIAFIVSVIFFMVVIYTVMATNLIIKWS